MVEGSLWVYGQQTDLTDFYAGRLTLRQLYHRFLALPHEAPIWDALRTERDKTAEQQKIADAESVVDRFKPRR